MDLLLKYGDTIVNVRNFYEIAEESLNGLP